MDVSAIYAAKNYASARAGTQPEPGSGQGGFMPNAMGAFEQTLKSAEDLATQSLTGDADPHALVQALAQSELAVETAVTVRNKVVEAYQEILRMPV